jgi:4-hydroxy-2-oxoheptanedioate aldolase
MPVAKSLKEKLGSGDVTTFALLTLPDPGVASILASGDIDAVIVDAEHGPFTVANLRPCLDAIALAGAWSVVRVPSDDRSLLKQILDLGPDGVQVPTVSTPDEAREIVRSCLYPPAGVRGAGAGRAQGYGARLADYYESANDRVAVIVMIETALGVENAREIAAVDGVDAIFIGPNDIAGDLGLSPLESGAPAVVAAVAAAVAAANEVGTPVGSGCAPADLAARVADGWQIALVLIDVAALAEAVRSASTAVSAASS